MKYQGFIFYIVLILWAMWFGAVLANPLYFSTYEGWSDAFQKGYVTSIATFLSASMAAVFVLMTINFNREQAKITRTVDAVGKLEDFSFAAKDAGKLMIQWDETKNKTKKKKLEDKLTSEHKEDLEKLIRIYLSYEYLSELALKDFYDIDTIAKIFPQIVKPNWKYILPIAEYRKKNINRDITDLELLMKKLKNKDY